MDARDLEVRCEECGAGFAVGTKYCVNCQSRLGRSRADAVYEVAFEQPHGGGGVPDPGAGAASSLELRRELPDEDEPDARRSGLVGTLLQVAFVVGLMALSLISKTCDG